MFSVKLISQMFPCIGLSLNIEKSEYLVFNPRSVSESSNCDSFFFICFVSQIRCLGIHLCTSISALRIQFLRDF